MAEPVASESPVLTCSVKSRLEMFQNSEKFKAASLPRPAIKPIRVREVVVAVMGATGAGKSRFVKMVTEDEAVVVGEGLQSETQAVRAFQCQHDGKYFSVVDCPGFNDTNRSDREILQELADWLVDAERNGLRISGILYLQRINVPRMEGSALRNLRMFRKLCGEDFLGNVILGTTFWDEVSDEVGARREKELLETESFFKEMTDGGCGVTRISGERDECLKLLSRFAAKQPSVIRLQQELLEGKQLEETGAASTIDPELIEMQTEYSKTKSHLRRVNMHAQLEKAFALNADRIKHGEHIKEMDEQREVLREEMERQKVKSDEMIATMYDNIARQKSGYQMELEQLQGQLRVMKASTAS